jgi:hypothetical protein
MTGDMSGVRTRQRNLLFVPLRAEGPFLSINFTHKRESFKIYFARIVDILLHNVKTN